MRDHLEAHDHVPMADDPVLYQIRINGHLGPTLLTAFPALVAQQLKPAHKSLDQVTARPP
jgi:hypothetical protein